MIDKQIIEEEPYSVGFDLELYKGYREIADSFINNIPFYYKGSFEDWVLCRLSMIDELVSLDDFEAAKAIRDSVIAFINKYIPDEEDRIPLNAKVNERYLSSNKTCTNGNNR